MSSDWDRDCSEITPDLLRELVEKIIGGQIKYPYLKDGAKPPYGEYLKFKKGDGSGELLAGYYTEFMKNSSHPRFRPGERLCDLWKNEKEIHLLLLHVIGHNEKFNRASLVSSIRGFWGDIWSFSPNWLREAIRAAGVDLSLGVLDCFPSWGDNLIACMAIGIPYAAQRTKHFRGIRDDLDPEADVRIVANYAQVKKVYNVLAICPPQSVMLKDEVYYDFLDGDWLISYAWRRLTKGGVFVFLRNESNQDRVLPGMAKTIFTYPTPVGQLEFWVKPHDAGV